MTFDRVRTILLIRFLVQGFLRLTAVVIIAIGVMLFLSGLLFGVSTAVLSGGARTVHQPTPLDIIGTGLSISTMFCPVIFGLLLAWQSKRLARWIVPALRSECPQCGYNLHLIKGDLCPECGYALHEPNVFHGPAGNHDSPPPAAPMPRVNPSRR